MIQRLFLLSVIAIFIIKCSNPEFRIDTSGISYKTHIKRFEQDLLNVPFNNIDSFHQAMINNYGDFYEIFNQNYLYTKHTNASYPVFLRKFVTDYRIVRAKTEVDKLYPNLDFLENEFTDAFKRYIYYFPEKNVPEVFSCINGFNQSVLLTDSAIVIALDKYLGSDFSWYENFKIETYKRRRMRKEYISTECLKGWISTEFLFNDSVSNLISHMIYHGQVQYCLDALLPHVEDTIKYAYSDDQLYWAKTNEDKIWGWFIENQLLFSTDRLQIKRYVEDAPFTTAFSTNSAPRSGIFVGRKIVGQYMKENPEVTLSELMQITDYQRILNKSKYNP